MTDLFTSLRRTDNRAEVDPIFRAELLTEIRRRLADTAPDTEGWIDVPLLPLEFDDTPPRLSRRPAWILVVAAAVTAIVVAALVIAIGNDDPPGEVPADQPTTVPVDDVAVAAATRVAAWGEESYWVRVYGDGRVIKGRGSGLSSLRQRYLTAAGLEGVQSGTVEPRQLLVTPDSLPEGMWADDEFTIYTPSEVAVELYGVRGNSDRVNIDPMEALGALPATVQELLRGTQRMYTIIDSGDPMEDAHSEQVLRFTVPPNQAHIVANTYRDGPYEVADGTFVRLSTRPVMPDGTLVGHVGLG